MAKLNHHRPPDWDRRQFNRFDGRGLVAILNNKMVDVLDISFGGVRIATELAEEPGEIEITLIPRAERKLEINDGIKVQAILVRTGDGTASVRFTKASYTLAKFIVTHTSKLLGVTPFVVK